MKFAVIILTILLDLAVHAEPQTFHMDENGWGIGGRNAAPSSDSRPAASPFLRKRNALAIEGRQAQFRKTENDATVVRQAAEANQTAAANQTAGNQAAISQADPSLRLSGTKQAIETDGEAEAEVEELEHLVDGDQILFALKSLAKLEDVEKRSALHNDKDNDNDNDNDNNNNNDVRKLVRNKRGSCSLCKYCYYCKFCAKCPCNDAEACKFCKYCDKCSNCHFCCFPCLWTSLC